jgi:hypothetical protein
MNAFVPLLILIVISSLVTRTANQAKKKAAPPRPGNIPRQAGPTQDPSAFPDAVNRQAPDHGSLPSDAAAEREPLRPAVKVNLHDDSVYQGSMNADTGEGFDPCHEEQMASMAPADDPVPMPAEEAVSAPLLPRWTGGEIARGFVMAEILNRRGVRP